MTAARLFPLVLLGSGIWFANGQTAGCPAPLSTGKKQALIAYLRAKYTMPDSLKLTLRTAEALPDSGYRRLLFQVSGPFGQRDLVFYLSPDERYLTGELLDTAADPAKERRKEMAAQFEGLAPESGSVTGNPSAPVTLVIFSDFQCQACRELAEALKAEPDRARVVFHHLPGTGHAWARSAAEGAICAQFQDARAFWAMHDRIFRDQQSITPENVRARLLQYAGETPGLSLPAFQTCLQNQAALGRLLQDENLASAYGVAGAPALFINGRAASPLKDAADLRARISAAERENRLSAVSRDAAPACVSR